MKNYTKTSSRFCHSHLVFSFIVFFLFLATANPGVNASPKSVNFNPMDKWVFHSEVKGVNIYYQLSTCETNSVIYLKFDNKNKYPVRIVWKEVFTTKQVPEEKEGFMGKKQLTLTPGITSQSDCTKIEVKECVTLAYLAIPHYKADIVKFNLTDISVTTPS